MKHLLLIIAIILNSCSSFNNLTLPIAKPKFFTENHKEENFSDLIEQLAHNPEDRQILLKIAQFHIKENNCNEFIEIANKLDLSNLGASQQIEIYNFKGKCLIKKAELKSAHENFNHTLSIDATNSLALSYIGLIHTLTRHFKEALVYHQIALDSSPNETLILNNMGIYSLYTRKYKEAENYFSRALQSSTEANRKQILPNLLKSLTLNKKHQKAAELLAANYTPTESSLIAKELRILRKSGFRPIYIKYK
ncbi:tetratricopeptide repeat protein [Rickettsiales endosymbiont of Stachyamoeba lipophora]|uniref:tetratricopeptide repeat protein n=1 Tax=Rickettsiales endosymbiont of Stachyamoeba lipophora TaxID=2486578 RepID=UPI000F6489CF|nr:hypothetical protein [Rickettsiales endosymbiont of Stachyamoeba lipophora]AZL15321.1 hypothetical protein EF513_01955 [Rickettsiales endosymbiont of Stachyamoeba lipophora]